MPMTSSVKDFYELIAWQKAHEGALEIYQITKNFPKYEQFGIISQLRRAASSISANIAEGFGRYHFKDKIRFYYQARASIAEVQNFLFLAKDLNYISEQTRNNLHQKRDRVRQLVNGLIRSAEKSNVL